MTGVGVPLRIDPHVHSDASYDGSEPVDLLVEQAAEIGLDAVVITDHDAIEGSLRAARLAPTYGLIGIVGAEVSTAAGHLLALGIETLPEPHQSVAATIEAVRAQGGVSIIPYPFQRSRHGVSRRRLRGVRPDAIETYNSWTLTGYQNRRAARYAARHDYPGVAGSDAHRAGYVGRAYTTVELPIDARADADAALVIDALRQRPYAIDGRRTPLRMALGHYLTAARRKLRYGAARAVSGSTSRGRSLAMRTIDRLL